MPKHTKGGTATARKIIAAEEKSTARFHKSERAALSGQVRGRGRRRGAKGRKFIGPQNLPKFGPMPRPPRTVAVSLPPPDTPFLPLTFQAGLGNPNLKGFGMRGDGPGIDESLYIETKNPTLNCIINGYTRHGDPRWKDAFSMLGTFPVVQHSVLESAMTNTISTAGGATYAFAGIFFGTNKVPGGFVSSISSSTTSTTAGDVPNWQGITAMPTLVSSADFVGRPIGQVTYLDFNARS